MSDLTKKLKFTLRLEANDWDNDIHLGSNILVRSLFDAFENELLFLLDRARKELEIAYKNELISKKRHLQLINHNYEE